MWALYVKNSRNSSPLRRGYFPRQLGWLMMCPLFPAQAGVFPSDLAGIPFSLALPRSGGGISGVYFLRTVTGDSSPLRRGYFLLVHLRVAEVPLFPAQAGVFPA